MREGRKSICERVVKQNSNEFYCLPGWMLRPPPFARISGAPGAAQTHTMTDFRSLKQRNLIAIQSVAADRRLLQQRPMRGHSNSEGRHSQVWTALGKRLGSSTPILRESPLQWTTSQPFLFSKQLKEMGSAELSHSLKVSGRRRSTPKSVQNLSESLCAGLWVPCRIFWVWFGAALGPNPVGNRRFPAGSLESFRGPFSSAERGRYWTA